MSADRLPARARTATVGEKAALWGIMTKISRAYDEYLTRTTRQIPVVMLERKTYGRAGRAVKQPPLDAPILSCVTVDELSTSVLKLCGYWRAWAI